MLWNDFTNSIGIHKKNSLLKITYLNEINDCTQVFCEVSKIMKLAFC